MSDRQRHIEWPKVIASAVAAVLSALALSTLGAAGTVIGAALGSVIFTVTSGLVTAGIDHSRRRMTEAHAAAMQLLAEAQEEVRRARRDARTGHTAEADAELQHAAEELQEAQAELDQGDPERARVPWSERVGAVPWGAVLAGAVGAFVVAVLAITAFELLAGRPLSSYTGGTSDHQGTSVSHIVDGGRYASRHHNRARRTPVPAPTPAATGTPHPSSSPSGTPTPTSSPTPTPNATTTPGSGPATAVPTP